MRIGKPESKTSLKFDNVKIGETFRPCERGSNDIYMKIVSVFDNPYPDEFVGRLYNAVNLATGNLCKFNDSIYVAPVDAYIEEVK